MKDIEIDFSKLNGIIPVVIQDNKTCEVLMLGFMNEEAYALTIKTGIVHYWSRSKNRIWKKGETSGNIQNVEEIRIDCDYDTLLIKVSQVGEAACHTGFKSCFHYIINNSGIASIDGERIFDPEKVYKDKK